MDAEQQLFGLMAIAEQQQKAAEEQQKAVKEALEGLAAERLALGKARAEVERAAIGLGGATEKMNNAVSLAGPVIVRAARDAITGAAPVAAQALSEASAPVLGRLSGVVNAAQAAEGSMRKAGQWFAWKWVALAGAGMAGVCLVAYGSLAWQLHERDALAAEVAQLQAQAEDFAKRGGRVKLQKCGDQKRLCVPVEKPGGYGENGDYYVLKGY